MQAYHEAYCADTVYSKAVEAIIQDVVKQINTNTLDQLLKPSGVQLCSRTLMFPPVFVVCNGGLLPANPPEDFMDVLKRRVNSELRNRGFLTVGSVAYTTLVSDREAATAPEGTFPIPRWDLLFRLEFSA